MALDARVNVLVVDDDADARGSLAEVLTHAGYRVREAADADSALREFDEERPHAVLLESDLGGRGWDLARRLRERTQEPALIFVSSRNAEVDRVRGLRLGADDYVGKPYGLAELLARMEAVLRRTHKGVAVKPTVYRDRVLSIDLERHEVVVRGEPVALSPTEYRLLLCLVENAGRVQSAEELVRCAWKDGTGSLGQVKIYIGYLRKKLEKDPARPRMIETVRGVGYRYERRVEE